MKPVGYWLLASKYNHLFECIAECLRTEVEGWIKGLPGAEQEKKRREVRRANKTLIELLSHLSDSFSSLAIQIEASSSVKKLNREIGGEEEEEDSGKIYDFIRNTKSFA